MSVGWLIMTRQTEEPSKCVEILVLTLKNGGNDKSVCNRVIAIINEKKTEILVEKIFIMK